jgi:hypothetical protein
VGFPAVAGVRGVGAHQAPGSRLLRKVFWPALGVQQYACGLQRSRALMANQNPVSEQTTSFPEESDHSTPYKRNWQITSGDSMIDAG